MNLLISQCKTGNKQLLYMDIEFKTNHHTLFPLLTYGYGYLLTSKNEGFKSRFPEWRILHVNRARREEREHILFCFSPSLY